MLLKGGDLAQDACAEVPLIAPADLDLQDAAERRPLLGDPHVRLEDLGCARSDRPVKEPLQRGDGREVLRHLIEGVGVPLDGGPQVISSLIELSQPEPEARDLRRLGRQLELLFEVADERLGVVATLGQALQPVKRLKVARVERVELREGRLGRPGVVPNRLVQGRHREEDACLLGVTRHMVELPSHHDEEVVPAGQFLVERDERGEQLRCVSGQGSHALKVDGGLCVPSQLVSAHLTKHAAEPHLGRRVVDDVAEGREQHDELGPQARLQREPPRVDQNIWTLGRELKAGSDVRKGL